MRQFAEILVGWGPGGLLILAALDSAGVPLPAVIDGLLIALSASVPGMAPLYAALAIVGSLIGSMFLFWLARRGGEAYLATHTVSPRGIKLRLWFQHYGLLTVFISAISPVPLPMKLFVLCAGALGVRPLHFFLTVVAARTPRYFGLAWLGTQLGHHAGEYLKTHALHIGGILLALFLVLFGAVKYIDARRARALTTE